MTLLVPVRTYNLGNALSVLGNGILLASRLGAKLFYPQFESHLPLFEGAPHRYGGVTDEDAALAISRMKTTRVTSSAFRESLPERPRVGADEFFAYVEIAEETLLVVRQQSYFAPLEALDGDLVSRYRVAFLYQPYQLSHQLECSLEPVRSHVRIAPALLDDARAKNASARAGREKLIGVHVRLGDYRTWREGRYAYELPEVLSLVQSVERRSPGVYSFRLFSNESDPAEIERLVARMPGVQLSFHPDDAFADFCGLSESDAVFGPPSSYSHWAAWLGRRPRLVFDNLRVQRLCTTRRYLDALPEVEWPFSVGLQNDFWLPAPPGAR